jgi:hypothetical protein
MILAVLGSLLALLLPAPGYAEAESDVFLQTVGFALTARDDTKVQAVDQANCVFRINNEIFHLNNVQRIATQDQVRKDKRRGEHKTTMVALYGEPVIYEYVYEGLKEGALDATDPEVAVILRGLKENSPEVFKPHNTSSTKQTLVLPTDEGNRVRDAWDYIYSHGCTKRKNPS